jgi:hypothetical protein
VNRLRQRLERLEAQVAPQKRILVFFRCEEPRFGPLP